MRIAIALLLLAGSAQAEPLKIIVSPHDLQPLAPWEDLCIRKLTGTTCDPAVKPPAATPPPSVGGATGMTILPRSYDKDGKLIK